MIQPFEPFTSALLVRLITLERPWLVSQTYRRADPRTEEKVLLLTDYNEPGGAKLHFNAVKNDRYAAIIDLENERHRSKLEEMLLPDSKYHLFFAAVQSSRKLEYQIHTLFSENIKRYIQRETNWRPRRGDDVQASVQLTFGELFVVLKHFSQSIRIRLADIEALPA